MLLYDNCPAMDKLSASDDDSDGETVIFQMLEDAIKEEASQDETDFGSWTMTASSLIGESDIFGQPACKSQVKVTRETREPSFYTQSAGPKPPWSEGAPSGPCISRTAGREQIVVPLSPEVHARLYSRRGRQRLKKLRYTSKCYIALGDDTGMLYASGTPSQIDNFKKQLQLLEGTLMPIAEDVWAELLRCRRSNTASEFNVTKLETKTSCGIHVDRFLPMVRVFGLPENLTKAREAFLEMEDLCTWVSFPLPLNVNLSMKDIQELAGPAVTAMLDGSWHIRLLGRSEAVAEAEKTFPAKLAAFAAAEII